MISRCISIQDFVPAINALGWYYEHFEQDYERAVQFWERADEMGNPEAPFNLGVMYSLGLYPGKRADQVSTTRSGLQECLTPRRECLKSTYCPFCLSIKNETLLFLGVWV